MYMFANQILTSNIHHINCSRDLLPRQHKTVAYVCTAVLPR